MKENPSINTGTDMSSIVSDPVEKDVIRQMGAREKKYGDIIQERQAKLDSLKIPEMPQMSEAPKQQDYSTDPMKTFGSSAMWLATFGSLLTRHPLTTALNSAAEVNKAAAAGDAAAYKAATDKWKTQSDYAMKLAQYDMDRYKEALSEGESGIRTYAGLMKSETASRALDMRQNEQHYKDMKREHEDLVEAAKSFQREAQYTQYKLELDDWKKNNPKATPLELAQKASEIAEGAMGKSAGLNDDKYDAFKNNPESNILADAYAQGVPPAELVKGMGKEAGTKLAAIQRLAAERHPDMDIKQSQIDFATSKGGAQKFAYGKQGDIVRSLNVSIQHLDTLDKLGEALANKDTKMLNLLRNKYKTEFGSELPTDFNTAKEVVGAEVTKAITGGVGSLTDREDLKQNFSNASSPEQLRGVVQTLKALLAGQMSGLKIQYEAATKKDDFDKFLLPSTKKELSSEAPTEKFKKAEENIAPGESKLAPLPPPKDKKAVPGMYYDFREQGDGIRRYEGGSQWSDPIS